MEYYGQGTPPGTPGGGGAAAAASSPAPPSPANIPSSTALAEAATSVGDFQKLFRRVLKHNEQLQTQLKSLQVNTDAAVARLTFQNETLKQHNLTDKSAHMDKSFMLVDPKTMCPSAFTGSKTELYKPWAKKVKAYVNSKRSGFRVALDEAEKQKSILDTQAVAAHPWKDAVVANSALYDLLVSITQGEALEVVELRRHGL